MPFSRLLKLGVGERQGFFFGGVGSLPDSLEEFETQVAAECFLEDFVLPLVLADRHDLGGAQELFVQVYVDLRH